MNRNDQLRISAAFAIVENLQKRIDDTCVFVYPTATMTVGCDHGLGFGLGVVQIDIGEVPVWCSEADSSDDFTADACWESYRKHVAELAEAFPDLGKGGAK